MSFQRQPTQLGDIVSDLAYYADAIKAANTPGGLQQWLAVQYAAFNKLPQEVKTLSGQVARVRAALASSDPSVVEPLDRAQADLSAITTAYPAVAQDIQTLVASIAPTLSMGGNLSVLDNVSVGINGIGAIHQIHELFAKRDNVQDILAVVTNNPTLDFATRQRVQQAMTGGTLSSSSFVKIGLIGVGVWAAMKLFGRGR
jgi:hypothetical protein